MSSERVVALEETFVRPDLVDAIDPGLTQGRGWPVGGFAARADIPAALADVGEGRVAQMDRAGITVQVLSAAIPGPDVLPPADGITMARDYNDGLAAAVAAFPDRFAGFAVLPLTAPEAAADELDRAVSELGFVGTLVNGTTRGQFLDHEAYEPLLARAERLGVPIYLHPNLPPPAVIEAYFSGLPGGSGFGLSMAGWGWHSETAIHLLRLVVSGALDRHPDLRLIIGHMGEGIPSMMDRFEDVLTPQAPHLERTVRSTILDQVSLTTSGIFSVPAFLAALLTFGAERIMFSVDYPYSDNQRSTQFLRELPVNADDRQRIASGNADRLLGLMGS